MSTPQSQTLPVLTDDNIQPFQSIFVARIFHEHTGWFIGFAKTNGEKRARLKLEGEHLCSIRFDLFAPFKRFDMNSDPRYVGETIVVAKDRMSGEVRSDGQAFRLKHPRKGVTLCADPRILVIEAFQEIAVLSQRPNDIVAVRTFIGIAEEHQ